MATEHGAAWRASRASWRAVEGKRRAEWLALFAEDACVEDPVGPSPLDEEGRGHRGKHKLAEFWDNNIEPNSFVFDFPTWYESGFGDEVANVGRIVTTLPNGYQTTTSLVAVYKVDNGGKLTSLRAFYSFSDMLATYTKKKPSGSKL